MASLQPAELQIEPGTDRESYDVTAGSLHSAVVIAKRFSMDGETSEGLTANYVELQEAEASMEESHESQAPLVGDVESSLLASGDRSLTVADVNRQRQKRKTPKGSTIRKADPMWYVFDDLSCQQAEDLLGRHGDHGYYLVAHFHDPESYGLSIRLNEDDDPVYKHYAISISGKEYSVETMPGTYPTIEDVVEAVQERMQPVKLIPIFHRYNCETCDYSISFSAEEPPEYSKATKYPRAALKPLPLIVPIRPTLRRMMGNSVERSPQQVDPEQPGERAEPVRHGGCWKLFHTDPGGQWYMPHKAGPITAFFLVLGWIIFLVLFGWIIGMALVLVFILVVFAYVLNFVCTGRCEIEEET